LRATRREIARAFGWSSLLAAPAVGAFLLAAMARERRRLRTGATDEPPTFYETNEVGAARAAAAGVPLPCGFVEA
jgi:hypothetical protein